MSVRKSFGNRIWPPLTRLRLLGPVQIEREGRPVRGFESHKALALLGYLIAQERPLTRAHPPLVKLA